jgi:hypothetical protein
MQVNEARSHHQAGGVDGAFSVAQLRPDRDDFAVQHGHVGNRVRPAREIHHPAAVDHYATHLAAPHAETEALPAGTSCEVKFDAPLTCVLTDQ